MNWKTNWQESRQNYLDWWAGRGLVVSMWEHIEKDGPPHAAIPQPPAARDLEQYWFDPEWRAAWLNYRLSRSSFQADMLAVANTQLGPGSLAAALGGSLEGSPDTIWIHPRPEKSGQSELIALQEDNPWYRLHLDLVKACRRLAGDNYLVGCPDLIEGLDTLAALYGTQPVLLDMVDQPEQLLRRLQAVNAAWFELFEQIYQAINQDGEMAFCYFSLWAPGRMAKLQCDLSGMISPRNYRRFVQPFIREQCQKLDYSMYHLDGVDAMRHLPALLEIEELDAIQWTPGIGQPQGGDPAWFELYKRIRGAGKSVMASLVDLPELRPLLDAVGPQGLHVLMNFTCERDVEQALEIVSHYR